MKRHQANWAVLVLGCIWLCVQHTRFNRVFRSVFRCFSDNISDNFCTVCTQTAFLIKKQKALGDFQLFFSDDFCVVCTGPNPTDQCLSNNKSYCRQNRSSVHSVYYRYVCTKPCKQPFRTHIVWWSQMH